MTGETQTTPKTRVLALVSSPGNRRVLVDWIRNASAYSLVSPPEEDVERLPAFDVCLVDRSGLQRSAEAIRRSQRGERTFLPCLLVEERGRSLEGLGPSLRSLIDDVVTAPINPDRLQFRIDTLARRRHLSEELWDAEERYRRLFELAPNAKLLVEDGEIESTNRAAEQFFQRESASLSGVPLERFVAAADRAPLRRLLENAPAEVAVDGPLFRTVNFEVGDRTAICEVAAVRTGEGDELLVLVQDATERIERERRLELYRRAMDEAAIGVTITDPGLPDNPIIYVNEKFGEITGYDRQEALGRNCRFLQGERTDEASVARLRRAIDAEEPVSEILVNHRRDGEPFYNALDVMPVTDASGTVTNFLGFQRDVTEWVRNRRRLSVLDRVLRHNVRNRMNVVTGYAEQLIEHDDPAVRTAAERILDAGEDLLGQSETARHFRDVVSDESATETRDLVVDVFDAIEEIRSGYPDVPVHTSLPNEAPIRGDQGVPLAVVETVENAVEHGEPPVIVRIDPGPDETRLSVTDRGEGIPEQEHTVFGDAEERPTSHAGGVGLWLVRWTVERIGGRIEYSDEDGTTVELYFSTAADESNVDR
ncbi:PAS domain S-box protein [Halobellus rarus]|uniref:PAS domain S-box protein n=1 Tax=Halobellus rarus TaxID=1126237 RepID=A0ABD6CN76_9EURY|nr:PAS domain S-box protein [Halobellus rarus]